jgi:hypothetical protein
MDQFLGEEIRDADFRTAGNFFKSKYPEWQPFAMVYVKKIIRGINIRPKVWY